MKVFLFFTYQISLIDWRSTGLLEREVKFYEYLYNKYGLEFVFFTYGDKEDKEILKDKNFISVLPIYETNKKSNFKIINFINSFFYPLKIKKQIQECDVLKTNQLNGAWVAIISKFFYKKKLVIRTGYDILDFAKKEKKGYLKVTFYFLLQKISIIFSDLYLVTSSSDLSNLRINYQKYLKKIKVRVNWVEEQKINPINKRFDNQILSVGRLVEQKNYKFLIESFENSNQKIDIYGNGELKNELLNLSISLNVDLSIYEPISNIELLSLMSKYKVFVSTSWFEGNPKVVLEAMSLGCIVICKKSKNIEEIITHMGNGLLFETKSQLKELVEFVFKENDKTELISKNAIDYIRKHNLIEKIAKDEYLDYLKLINS